MDRPLRERTYGYGLRGSSSQGAVPLIRQDRPRHTTYSARWNPTVSCLPHRPASNICAEYELTRVEAHCSWSQIPGVPVTLNSTCRGSDPGGGQANMRPAYLLALSILRVNDAIIYILRSPVNSVLLGVAKPVNKRARKCSLPTCGLQFHKIRPRLCISRRIKSGVLCRFATARRGEQIEARM